MVSMLAVSATIPVSSPIVDGYFGSQPSKRSESSDGYCGTISIPAVKFSLNLFYFSILLRPLLLFHFTPPIDGMASPIDGMASNSKSSSQLCHCANNDRY